MSNQQYGRKLTLFYKGLEYRFLWANSVKDASEWMRKETQLMPYNKRHLYFFTIEARQNDANAKNRKTAISSKKNGDKNVP